MNFLEIKNFLLVFLIIFSYLISVAKTYAVDITADRTISSSSDGDQYNIKTNNDIDVIVTNNSTLERNQKIFNVSASSLTGSSITIHLGSSVIAETNSIFSNGAELTITNTGTIEATNSKAINVSNSDGVSITNNNNGVIKSNNNTILGDAGTGADNVTIDNSGEIYTTATGTESSAIVFANNDTGNTITNNSGGEIYSSGSESTIVLGVSSTLTNSGSIKNNKSVTNKAIQLKGNNNTVTLKDAGIVVGKIRSGNGTTGNKLRFNHGVGRAYYYDISGDFTLEDLDGNQVVIGSAGSVGQGGSETIDEMLSYKSINLRNFLNRYENSNLLNHEGGWGELYSNLLNRSEDSNSLAMEYNLINIGANLIYPLENSNFIMMFEGGVQDFAKDYKITYQNISGGINIPENDKFFNLDTFVTGGITLKDGKRTVLTLSLIHI